MLKQPLPCVVWLTGLSGAGKTTLVNELHARLSASGCRSVLLDGDTLRQGINRDLGFSPEDRTENVRRTAELAHLLLESGLVVLVALISPSRAAREQARSRVPPGRFIEVFVDAPLAQVQAQDPKGIYGAARRGELTHVAGLDLEYEPPVDPEVHVRTAALTVTESAKLIFAALPRRPKVRLECG